jgi:hypothetical protein
MTPDEAETEVNFLGSLFPRSNQTELDFWQAVFQRYPQPRVRSAVLLYAEHVSDFIDRTQLRAAIANQLTPDERAAMASERTTQRKRELTAELQQQAQRQRMEEAQARQSYAAIDAALTPLSDVELESLKGRVVEAVKVTSAAMAKILQRSDIHTGKYLRTLMAGILQGGADSSAV